MKILVRGGLHDTVRLCQLWAASCYAWVFEQVVGCLVGRGRSPLSRPMWGHHALACQVCLSAHVSCPVEAPGPRAHIGRVFPLPQGETFTAGQVFISLSLHSKPMPCPLSSQYACGIKAEVVGKPSPEFFKSALQEMGLEAHQVGRPRELCVGRIGALARGSLGACGGWAGSHRQTPP